MLATVNGQRTLIMQWEDLHIGVQAAAAFVVSFVLLVIAHIALLNQPLGRALWYGLFWGVIATVIVVLGTRAERARRLARDSDSLR
jgi:cobalamin synthase